MKIKVLFALLIQTLSITTFAQLSTDSTYVPVRISSLNGQIVNNQNRLTWKTACFLQYARFDIQRSYDGLTFSSVDNFTADQLRCQQPFDFDDLTANRSAGRVFYRINVGDIDGHYFHSKIVALFMEGNGLEVHNITPSIVNSSATLNLSSSFADKISLQITNASGVTLVNNKVSVTKGLNTIRIDASTYSKGMYWVTIISEKADNKTISFIKN